VVWYTSAAGRFGRGTGGAHSKHLPLQEAVNLAENRLKRFALRRHLLLPKFPELSQLPRQLGVECNVCCAVVMLYCCGLHCSAAKPKTSAWSWLFMAYNSFDGCTRQQTECDKRARRRRLAMASSGRRCTFRYRFSTSTDSSGGSSSFSTPSWVQCVLCCCNVLLLWVALFRSQAKNFSLKLTIYGFLFAVCRLRLAMIITVGWIFGQLKAVIHWPESTAGP